MNFSRVLSRTPRARPAFQLPVVGDPDAMIARLRRGLETPEARFEGQVRGRHAYVRLPEENRTLLSPHLNLEVREAPVGFAVHGRFSPHPNVWMGFVALFFVIGMFGLGGAIWAAAQAMLGGPIWTLWFVPASVALIAFIYGAAFIGQGLSAEEMYALRAFVERIARGEDA